MIKPSKVSIAEQHDYEELWGKRMHKPKSGKIKNKDSAKFKATLAGGAEIIGTEDQILKLAKAAGIELTLDEGYYKSSSKGWLPIDQMHLAHTRNAILSHYKNWLDDTRKLSDKDFIAAIELGPWGDPFVHSLIDAFIRRVSNGESSTDKKRK